MTGFWRLFRGDGPLQLNGDDVRAMARNGAIAITSFALTWGLEYTQTHSLGNGTAIVTVALAGLLDLLNRFVRDNRQTHSGDTENKG